ncbi:uncharacterized protein DEA37_0011180 [Paragonimus westermani]|uniref:RNA-binding protein 26 n=1 Tax=Paragonimus westermani TaxID=34504 RepID=A0A5J4NGK1_9TREM|nr:uncharacterized protein DEA37_0011180 [Paragonimus westermani]
MSAYRGSLPLFRLRDEQRMKCVADPVPLSQYVIALIKKDKSDKELKDICIDQLEVFLQENTSTFVEDLFTSLKTRSYVGTNDEKVDHQHLNSSNISSAKHGSITEQPENTRDKKRHIPCDSGSDSTASKHRRKRSTSRKAKSITRSRSRSPQPAVRSSVSSTSSSFRNVRKAGEPEINSGESTQPRGRAAERSDDQELKSNSSHNRRSGLFGTLERGDRGSYARHRRQSRERSTRERPRSPERERYHSRVTRMTVQEGRASSPNNDDASRKRRCRNYDERGFCLFGTQCPFAHLPVAPSTQTKAAVEMTKQLSASSYPGPGYDNLGSSVMMQPAHAQALCVQTVPMVSSDVSGGPDRAVSGNVPNSSGILNSFPILPVYKPTPIQQPSIAVTPTDGVLTTALLGAPPATIDGSAWTNASCILSTYQHHLAATGGFRTPAINLIRHNVIPIPMAKSDATSLLSEPHSPVVPPAYEPDKPQISMDSNQDPLANTDSVSEPPMAYTPSPISERPAPTPVTGLASQPTTISDSSSFPSALYVNRLPWRLNNETRLTEHFSKFGTLVKVVPRYFGIPDAAMIEFSNPDETEKAYRSPEPILSNRFIRLSTMPPSRADQFRKGRHTPYDMRPKTIMERLGHRAPPAHDKYDWLRNAVDSQTPLIPPGNFNVNANQNSSAPKGGRSRWRLERGDSDRAHKDAGSADEQEEEEDEDDRMETNRDRFLNAKVLDDSSADHERGRSTSFGYTMDRTFDSDLRRETLRGPLKSRIGSHSDKIDTVAYLWQRQKALALKKRQEQLKLLDKSREAKQTILDAQKQRVSRLKNQLKSIMTQLEAKSDTTYPDSGGNSNPQITGANRRLLLAEAKRIQAELEAAVIAEKKVLLSGSSSNADPTHVGSTTISAAALQALPEPLAAERIKQISEVRSALKLVEQDLAMLLSKGESVVEQRRRILELKRQLVELETVRPSDFAAASQGCADSIDQTDLLFPCRSQTKLDKRPRTVFVSGLAQQDVTEFPRALALNYLHTQKIVKHSDPVTSQPILEITFCTRDFAEAAMRQFHHFHDRSLRMSFSAPPLAEAVSATVTGRLSSTVSSTQVETVSEEDGFVSTRCVSGYSAHSSPTSTTVPTSDA